MRTVPVNQSAGPLPEGCEPLRLISILIRSVCEGFAHSIAAASLQLLTRRSEEDFVHVHTRVSATLNANESDTKAILTEPSCVETAVPIGWT
jgi:hypothetical protein